MHTSTPGQPPPEYERFALSHATTELIHTRLFTQLFKLFALVALLEGTSKFCYLIHYGLYSNDGIGMSSLASMGEGTHMLLQRVLSLAYK